MKIFLASPPETAADAARTGLELAHLDYKLEDGRLWRIEGGGARGGLMVCELAGLAAESDARAAARDILAECSARDYGGVVLSLERAPNRSHIELARLTGAAAAERGMLFFSGERLALAAGLPSGAALIPASPDGGSLEARLREAAGLFGAERVALEIDVVMEDITPPSPPGAGRPLSRGELSALAARYCKKPQFSEYLCCNYFTYRAGASRHVILYDDLASVRAKLSLGASLDIGAAFLFYPRAADFASSLRGE
ncbi:MAG: hypothetical protein LBS51_07905 [Oscillospiraceae bacterium]|jgi:hypothetical protein|nr:hypothetical protein [Oscillospiraceae bacterium]